MELLINNKMINGLTEISLALAPNTTFEEWESIGQDLQRIGRCWQWWIGDWLNFGESQFGEKYTQAIEETGFAHQTLMNCAYVASKVEISRRREILSWTHHSEIARFEPDQQTKWLKLAAKQSFSEGASGGNQRQ